VTALIITRGLPGCGKTTRARQWVAEDREHRARVNRDDIRAMLDDGEFVKGVTEPRIIAARDAAISSLLRQGVDVISDDTNLPQRTARDLARLAAHAGAGLAVIDLTDVPLETCLKRNAARTDKPPVPEEAIRDMHARYLAGRGHPLPLRGRGPVRRSADGRPRLPPGPDDRPARERLGRHARGDPHQKRGGGAVTARSSLRVSETIRIGPFRIRLSAPLDGKGRAWGSAGVRAGRRGWLGVSAPLGGGKGRRR
jgi:predicted kinase